MQHRDLGSKIGLCSALRSALVLIGLVAACRDSAIPAASVPGRQSPTTEASGAQAAQGDDRSDDEDDRSDEDGESSSRDDDDEAAGPTFRPDGETCRNDQQCASGHCDDGVCCGGGECCVETDDCAAEDGIANICEYTTTCQGSRGEVECVGFRCLTKNATRDDSGCDVDTEADDCGPYASVYCSGAVEQQAPTCAQSCDGDVDCDRDALCVDAVCLREPPAVPDAACQGDAECASGEVCRDGVCVPPADGTPVATPARPAPAAPVAEGASCISLMPTRDACAECACSQCEATAMACVNSGDAVRDGLCKAVLDCALPAQCLDSMDCRVSISEAATRTAASGRGSESYVLGCFGRTCYCVNEYCQPASGPCVESMRAAAGNTTNSEIISARLRDPAYAVSYAESHAECLQANCEAECGLQ
jgi:hypothetical protein